MLPNGRLLLDDVSFRVGEGAKVALVGANGAGKTTLLRLVAGDEVPQGGTIGRSGGLGVMRQFIGSVQDATTVRDLLLSVSPPGVRAAGAEVAAAELAMMETDDEPTQLRYAHALANWGDAGGYEAEVAWDVCTIEALGLSFDRCQYRLVATLSGGEQKRLVLEALLRGRPGGTGTVASTSYANAGMRSTDGSWSWCVRCNSRRRSHRTWRASTTPCRRGWRNSKTPAHRRPRHHNRRSRCGCVVDARGCGQSPANTWN